MKNYPLDVLIPTCDRPAALAVTLTSLAAQAVTDFRIVISDQSETFDPFTFGEVQAVLRLLHAHDHAIETHKHLPKRGMAEQRQFLLNQATAPYALFIDDDLILEPWVISQMLVALREEKCGFVGCAPIGLSFIHDIRPQEETIEFWEGPVQPEQVRPGTPAWERYRLHNAANLYHLQQRLNLHPSHSRKYHIAWVGACVLYDTAKLREIGGYNFWPSLPPSHAGEDVLAQIRLMNRYGGCGLIPSGVYHQELPTTLRDRHVDAPKVLTLETF